MNFLLIEDDPVAQNLLVRQLDKYGLDFEPRCIASQDELEVALDKKWDAILADHAAFGMDLLAILKRIRARSREVPVIAVSGGMGEEATAELLREGLTDIVYKDRIFRLAPALRHALAKVSGQRAHRDAEAALLESRVLLEETEAIAHLGSWVYDLIENRVDWSNETYRIFGLLPQSREATYETFLDFVHPEDRAIVDTAYSDSLRGNQDQYEIEHRIVRQDNGEIRLVHEKCRHYRDDSGRVVRSVGMVHDITERKQAEAALRENENRFRALVEQSLAGIYIIQDGMLRYVNPSFAALYGYDAEELIDRIPAAELVSPEDRELVAENLRRRLEGEMNEIQYSLTCLHRDGRRIDVEVHGRVISYRGRPAVMGILLDITEHNRQIEALRERELRYRGVIEAAQDGFLQVNPEGRLLSINRAYCRMSGYEEEELLALTLSDLEARENPLDTAEHIVKLYDKGYDRFETIHRRKDGSLWPVEVSASLIPSLADVFVFVRDLTEIKALEAERSRNEALIRKMAFHDSLTQLPNRLLLTDRLKQALSAARRSRRHGALLFIDFDNFKQLNDSLGHEMGDLMLVQAAQRLSACVRDEDTVARLGGDEFVVMLASLSEDAEESALQARGVAEKIVETMNRPYQLRQNVYKCTPSIGIALFQASDEIDDVFRRADSAMYRAKRNGRNAICFFRGKT